MNDIPEQGKMKQWTPVRVGLFSDQSGKHYRKMGLAIWVFAFLLSKCNRNGGKTRLKQEAIARATGISLAVVKRHIKRLKDGGYIEVKSDGQASKITVGKWQSIRKQDWQHSTATHYPTPTPSGFQSIKDIATTRQEKTRSIFERDDLY